MSRKALNLVKLSNCGIRTPHGFLLDETHYREAILPYRGDLIRSLGDEAAIRAIFSAIEIPRRTSIAIDEGFNGILQSCNFAVRSSGLIVTNGKDVAEDSQDCSLAGQFESFLNVPKEAIADAVVQSWASLFNERSLLSFAADEQYVDSSAMSVLIQEMVLAKASAVVMTVDPLSDGATGGIELAVGPCSVIVDGSICPDEVIFARRDGSIVEQRIGKKEFALEYDVFMRGRSNGIRKNLPDHIRRNMSVSEEVLRNVISLALEVESIFGTPQDIELVVDANDEITIVQSRPITRLPENYIRITEIQRHQTKEMTKHA